MLDLLNRYAHGYVAVPVIDALRQREAFDLLRLEPAAADTLAGRLRANPGHLAVALRLLVSLGWLDRDAEGRHAVTPSAQLDAVPAGLTASYDFDWPGWLAGQTAGPGPLQEWEAHLRARWAPARPWFADFLDGVLLLPLLNGLNRRGLLESAQAAAGFPDLPAEPRQAVTALFRDKGWSLAGGGITDAGRFVVERGGITGTTASYGPMLRQLPALLFGDCSTVFGADSLGHERHLDRSLNVVASGFQHQKYFTDLEDAVLAIFDREPFSEQPRAIVDMGCGDGSLLLRLWQAVRERSARGRVLDRHPLTLVGADYNAKALEETAKTLTGTPHLLLRGDIADPDRLMADLATAGFAADDILHVRSFLDHDRPWRAPLSDEAEAGGGDGVYVDASGGSVAPSVARQSLVEHLRRWAGCLGRHGLLLLEVHSLEAAVVRRYRDESECLHFDAYHAFSGQQLVEADGFLLAAAAAGLFGDRRALRRYPRVFPLTRIALHRFERRPWRIRLARPSDLPTLLRLEIACWPEPLRSPEALLRRRLERAGAHCVLETEEGVVAVAYSQRIAAVEQLQGARWEQVDALHRDDGPVLQLLGVNVLPEAQDRGLGDQFLDFLLQWASLTAGIESVAGITRCRDWRAESGDYAGYVAARDAEGLPLDPILRFHARHGARIQAPLAGYRPADADNQGHGVLLTYDLEEEESTLGAATGGKASTGGEDLAATVNDCIRRVMRPGERAGYSPRAALRDLGLDSADLLELRALLSRRLGLALEPTFFFSHGSGARIAKALSGESEPLQPPAPRPLPPAPAEAAGAREAIAVLGLACRFPGGASTPETYWELIREGRNAVSAVPAARGPDDLAADPGVAQGGFLDGIELFDAAHFGIAPREARLMDPQQRLLLEVGLEALEQAGIDPDRLRGGRGGVFVGLFAQDYETRMLTAGDPQLDIHFATGTSGAVAAGRLAYVFGLEGPALTVNTACSSSLVAVHLACRSLLAGESDIALAGGVNLLLAPAASRVFARAGMLSPSGRCRTFDAEADGYLRSEGCGLVVLKRLSQAQADGDRIAAVIRGSAVNQDGASNGLTAPSGPAQQRLIIEALAGAGVAPAEVELLEAHGTGTPLGDPVEVEALGAVYGRDRPAERPLRLGAVKALIGHSEAAAGVAGLIKAVLALQHATLPPHPQPARLNPRIELASIPASLPARAEPWRVEPGRRRFAAVSSFGFSGTNAHVILEEAPEAPPAAAAEGTPVVLPVSADSPSALGAQAERWADWIDARPGVAAADVAATAAEGRRQLPLRAAVVGRDAAELSRGLRALAEGRVKPSAPERPPRIAFLFTGQGSQFLGMGRRHYEREPVFQEMIDRCAAVLDPLLERPLHDLLFGSDAALLQRTGNTQPALFALEVALAALWRARGVEPAVMIGHSVGEIAAACVAGCLGLEDGLALVAARGRLMQALPEGGAMVAILAEEHRVAAALAPFAGRAEIAAVNGPRNVVVSGEAKAVRAAVAPLEAEGLRCVALAVSHAFHSPAMDPMLEPFGGALAGLDLCAPRLPLISTVTGALAGAELADPAYWVRQARAPVRFADAVAALDRFQIDACLEIGPRPVLTAMARGCLPDSTIAWLGCPEGEETAEVLARLYRLGAPLDWRAIQAGRPYRRQALPTYPFQRQRHWADIAPPASAAASSAGAAAGHPLLGRRLQLPGSRDARWQARYTANTTRFFDDHRLFGRIVVPAASHVSMMFASLAELGPGPHALADLLFPAPLLLDDEGARLAQLVLEGEEQGRRFSLYTAQESDEGQEPDWTLHARGAVTAAGSAATLEPPSRIAARCGETMSGHAFYEGFRAAGYDFGPAMCWIEDVSLGDGEALCRLQRPPELQDREEAYAIYPALLDAAFQLQGVWFETDTLAGSGHLFVPFSIDRLILHAPCRPGEPLWSHVRRRPDAEGDRDSVFADLRLIDSEGRVRLEAQGFRFRRVARASLLAALEGAQLGADDLYRLDWIEAPLAAAPALPEPDRLAEALTAARSTLNSRLRPLDDPALLAGSEAHCRAAIVAAFAEAGVVLAKGAELDLDETARRLGLAPRHRRLLERLFALLSEGGLLSPTATGWQVKVAPAAEAPSLEALRLAHPAAGEELTLLGRCTAGLGAVLRGETDPLDLLFPEGDLGALTRLYRDAPGFAAMNHLTAEAAGAALAHLPQGRRLRVLEVGAGTGATTTALLDALPADRTDYLFTDVSARFLEPARAGFAAWGSLETTVLDLERPLAEQGLAERRFDLVVAANVLHATRDLGESLAHLSELLAPGGLLLLQETTAPRGWVDLSFGLTEGWWRFTDRDRRPHHPLLAAPAWKELLQASGFQTVETVEPDGGSLLFRQSLLLARKTGRQRWLLLGGSEAQAQAVAAQLGETDRLPGDAHGLEALPGPWSGILHLGGLACPSGAEGALAVSGEVLAAVQALLRRPQAGGPLWLVTRGAQAAEGEDLPTPEAAALWGLGRSARIEYPELALRLLDLDPVEEGWATALAEAVAEPDGEEEALLRRGRRLAPRLQADAAPDAAAPYSPSPDRFCLLTGGLGGIGLRLAERLVRAGARRLLLAGRSEPGPEATTAIERLRAEGAEVIVQRADLARPESAAELVAAAAPLGAAFHLAGRLDDGGLPALTPQRLAAVMEPKATGAWALHAATRDLDLDAFVLFSSVAGLLGNAGQANHAAANAALDALALHRQGLGLPALSVAWGAWAEVGSVADYNPFLGLRPQPVERCLDRLFALIGSGRPAAMVAEIDWPLLLNRRPAAPRMLAAFAPAAAAPAGQAADAGLLDSLRRLPPEERLPRLTAAIAEAVAAVLGLPAGDAVERRQGFFKLGMDSLTSVELRNRLQAQLGRPLPATLAFDHPDVESLAEHLLSTLFERQATPDTRPPAAGEDDLSDLTIEELGDLIDQELDALGLRELAS